MIGFGEAIGLYYRNYVNFQGRATRAEYWWPLLMQIIVYVGMVIVAFATLDYSETGGDDFSGATLGLVLAFCLFILINFLPSLSVAVRRFHDLDQTGWLVLIFIIAGLIIPGAGLAEWIWFAFRGTDGPNKYGPDPFGYDADVFG